MLHRAGTGLVVSMLALLMAACGGGGGSNSGGGGGTTVTVAPTPTGLTATAGNGQITLSWTASSGATSYHLKRATVSGGPYTQVAAPASNAATDTGLANGTKYFYVVSAVNSAGESSNSTEASATPVPATTSVHITVNVLTDRHPISPYVYGGAYPKDVPTVSDSGLSVVRWGGNATSTYNWQLHINNSDFDYYFEDFASQGFNNGADADSVQFIQDVKAQGSNPLMTMVMLPWVAKSAETPGALGNGHWSFSIAKYGAQCAFDPFNTDAGNGIMPGTCTSSLPTFLTANPNDAYFPLLDQPGGSDPAGSVYRSQWAAALATAFGSAPHFYDMDNEIDIWGGTHRDIHPNPTTYDELSNVFLNESRALKGWDPAAVRFGPVSCCWYFYWRSAFGSSDTSSHGGVDFLPWWINEIAWSDQIAGARSLDVLDVHAYPDGPNMSNFTNVQKQAAALRVYRDWWDPAYTSEASYIQNGGFSMQPVDSRPIRIPRLRALVNMIYPGTQFGITEWSAEFAGTADFSTALGDAEAYGILGRERVYLATRWTTPDPANPNYQALKLYTNYDGQHHKFASISVSDTHDGDPNLFSTFAAVNSAGTSMTIMLVNKDPQNGVSAQIAPSGFTPASVTIYTLSQNSPNTLVPSASQAWTSTVTVAPYSATLLVITGTMQPPGTEWDLNPDTIMVPAGGTVTLQPKITSGAGPLSLTSETSDSGITVSLTQPNLTTSQTGTVTVTAGTSPGFYHYALTSSDNQTQGGWIVVGNPAATLTKSQDPGVGARGTNITLQVTLVPGQSHGAASGASILFTTDAGSLASNIVKTDPSGIANIVLTLPAVAGPVHVTAQGPYGLGHPVVVFNEVSQ